MKTKFLIVTCETQLDFSYYQKDFFIIGVERGCLDLIGKNIKMDLAVSDFDQVLASELTQIQEQAKSFEKLDCQKDNLDGTYAIKKAYELGATEIVFVAKPTNRVDMNLTILEYCYKYHVKFLNDNTVAYCLGKGTSTLSFAQYQGYTYITFFPVHETLLTISGLKYNIEDLHLLPNSTRAFSNEFIPNTAGKITTTKPVLVIFNK
ncbi:thiamine pyrophosphokinase [Spiroplasma clarkii]|uniref:Thiamine diphosphokinase n=1 Tax=Spiroplasma clarkii TaxID=2139 RepID=A0A1Y0KZN4_9MOLU|nr:thiamine diphosphokinase [Spiroplasma clarkii]ARU91222.1 thiamine pyrophosphokinase [Spiroplasma clarkii]ATX70663.1 thiamine pyrophosphokinase [Spiroplasma clarkii]